tara:strand:+ start:153 stop:1298 length:1146 start_codon:yes stop_codon:yes gene_type:complete
MAQRPLSSRPPFDSQLAHQRVAKTKKKKKKYKEEVLPAASKASLTTRIDCWHAALPGPPLHFEPTLSADERKFVHALCESRGSEMSSKSEGKGDARHVVVFDAPVAKGVVGGVSAARRTELTAHFESWSPDVERPLHFAPTLTTAEREFVHHIVAAQSGLSSSSEGVVYHGDDWHIVVRRDPDSHCHSGVVVDCGSGHTSVMFYSSDETGSVSQVKRAWLKHADGGNLPLTDIFPGAKGGAFQSTTVADRCDEFIENLKGVLKEHHSAEEAPAMDSLFVGATGGMREKMVQGEMGEVEVATIRSVFERSFSDDDTAVTFDVLTGAQEAAWEHQAAQILWGGRATVMFPDAAAAAGSAGGVVPTIGLFSGRRTVQCVFRLNV